MSGHNHRRPTFAEHVSAQKSPSSVQGVSGKKTPAVAGEVTLYSEEKAAWRFGRIQLVKPYGWHVLDIAGVNKIKARLAELERCTWKDIFVRDADDNHRFDVATLKCPTARNWLQNNMSDQPSIWTIKVASRERIWGILAEGAYRIIFWDPNHLIWPVPKKHT
jgi:hypothetical protein